MIDPAKLGWKGLHELFNKSAQASWEEALGVYRAAWKHDLSSPELDRLAAASSMRQRYMNAYWIKEKVFRAFRDRIGHAVQSQPEDKERLEGLLRDYIQTYYTGQFDKVVEILGQTPVPTP